MLRLKPRLSSLTYPRAVRRTSNVRGNNLQLVSQDGVSHSALVLGIINLRPQPTNNKETTKDAHTT